MSFIDRMLQNAANRVAYGLGSQAAAGRLEIGAVAKDVKKHWARYLGREGVRNPNVSHVQDFLNFQYGLETEQGAFGAGTVDMETLAPRLANVLIRNGLVGVEL